MGLEFLFALLYAFATAGACLVVGRRLRQRGWRRLGAFDVPLAWIAIAAGLFDWGENVALAIVLLDRPASPWTEIAFACAVPKFTLIAVAVLYELAGGAVSLTRKPTAVN